MEGLDLKYIDYGVCDSPEQLASKFPTYEGLVWMTVVRRSDQPAEGGGWRWRKWGTYVGIHIIDTVYNGEYVQYLSQCDGEEDRPLIGEQYVFSVSKPDNNVLGLEPYRAYRVKDGQAQSTDEYVKDIPLLAFFRAAMK